MQALNTNQAGFQQTFDASDRFAEVFNALMRGKELCDCCTSQTETLLKSISTDIESAYTKCEGQLDDLERHPEYSRHVIGTDGDWTALICRWEAGASSSVHGHPAFTFYYVLQGKFIMDLYKSKDGKSATLNDSRQLNRGDTLWDYGQEGRYDNLIHRVAAREHGYTLQLFSEDPALGQVF